MSKGKVFLGGTCNGKDWRPELIKKLTCDYFNPLVKDWTEERRLIEIKERETDDKVLYTLTKDMIGVYSVAEVTDDSNKRPEKTILCILKDGFTDGMLKSLDALGKVADGKATKIIIPSDLQNIASLGVTLSETLKNEEDK